MSLGLKLSVFSFTFVNQVQHLVVIGSRIIEISILSNTEEFVHSVDVDMDFTKIDILICALLKCHPQRNVEYLEHEISYFPEPCSRIFLISSIVIKNY